MKTLVKTPLATLVALAALNPAVSFAEGTVADAVKSGTVNLDLRYRYEEVEQDNALEDAEASTLKSRLTYTSGKYNNFQMQVEVDNVAEIGSDEYNSGTNGRANYSAVVDPTGTDLNQAWLAYTGLDNTTIKYGRQRIVLDNQRFVGGVAWRQNEQTYDALAVVNTSIDKTTVIYAFVDNVNDIKGNDLDTSAHVLNVKNTALPIGAVTAYAYLLDVTTNGAENASTDTYGVRLAGDAKLGDDLKLLYTAEYATQSEGGDSALSYDADYLNLELGVAVAGVTAILGQEELTAEDGVGFSTPLATKHKFNGWADMFLATPTTGLQDNYLSLSTTLGGVNLTAVYHDFEATEGSASYGDELDLSAAKKFGDNLTVLLKYASYDADEFAVDTDKLWIQLQLTY